MIYRLLSNKITMLVVIILIGACIAMAYYTERH